MNDMAECMLALKPLHIHPEPLSYSGFVKCISVYSCDMVYTTADEQLRLRKMRMLCQQTSIISSFHELTTFFFWTYPFIKSLRVLLNRFLALDQTQHQRMLYAQLSSLQKLKIRYVAVFNKDLDRFKLRILFFVIF
jgi:hypothetical protein